MASKKPKQPKAKLNPVPATPEKITWWERLTTRVSSFGTQEWVGAGVVVAVVVLVVSLYASR